MTGNLALVPYVAGRPIACAVSAASRFVPLPFVDDVLRTQCERYVVAKVLQRSNRTFSEVDVPELFEGVGQSRVGGWLKAIVTKGLLFPIRRVVRIARSATGVPRDALRPLLLGRALARSLQAGYLENVCSPEVRTKQALAVRIAFDAAFKEAEDMLLRRLWQAIRSVRDMDLATVAEESGLGEATSEFDALFQRHLGPVTATA